VAGSVLYLAAGHASSLVPTVRLPPVNESSYRLVVQELAECSTETGIRIIDHYAPPLNCKHIAGFVFAPAKKAAR